MMQAKIIDRKWVVEWFDERQCYHMPSLTLADNGNLLAVWNGGFLQWNGDPMGRDAKDWVSVLEPGAKEWSNPDAVGCDIRYCCHDPVFLKNKKGEIPTTTARHGKKAPSSLRTTAISSGSRRFAFGRTAPSVCSRVPVRAVRAGARA